MTGEVESALFYYQHLGMNARGYIHRALHLVVHTVDQRQLVIAIGDPTELRRLEHSFSRRLQIAHQRLVVLIELLIPLLMGTAEAVRHSTGSLILLQAGIESRVDRMLASFLCANDRWV